MKQAKKLLWMIGNPIFLEKEFTVAMITAATGACTRAHNRLPATIGISPDIFSSNPET
jgi:hypothetical protein